MPQVTLNINGNPYSLACNEGEEKHLEELGTVISAKVGEVSESMGQIGDAKLLLMAALLLLDESRSETSAADRVVADARASAEAVLAAAAQIENIADQIESA
ncbi:MAG: cell division protein ZapA [Alphaproteobacteria bacterium]|nr:MAG: cell division protein ZapA [Alphaproteobacteria bacterium]